MARGVARRREPAHGDAATLQQAGIPIALQSGYEDYVPKTRVVLFEAAIAAAQRAGVRRRALRAITIDAARILGVDERVGSLEVGKDGDLALYDGDPFEYTTHCIGVVHRREGRERDAAVAAPARVIVRAMSGPMTTRRAFIQALGAAGAAALVAPRSARAADSRIDILLDEPIGPIAPEIYGHFAEHLGGVVYDGIWVGDGSPVPNDGGIRKSIVEKLEADQGPRDSLAGGLFRRQLRLA